MNSNCVIVFINRKNLIKSHFMFESCCFKTFFYNLGVSFNISSGDNALSLGYKYSWKKGSMWSRRENVVASTTKKITPDEQQIICLTNHEKLQNNEFIDLLYSSITIEQNLYGPKEQTSLESGDITRLYGFSVGKAEFSLTSSHNILANNQSGVGGLRMFHMDCVDHNISTARPPYIGVQTERIVSSPLR